MVYNGIYKKNNYFLIKNCYIYIENEMNTENLKKNSKEELIIYIEKLSRDMMNIQEENLELRKDNLELRIELQLYKDKENLN